MRLKYSTWMVSLTFKSQANVSTKYNSFAIHRGSQWLPAFWSYLQMGRITLRLAVTCTVTQGQFTAKQQRIRQAIMDLDPCFHLWQSRVSTAPSWYSTINPRSRLARSIQIGMKWKKNSKNKSASFYEKTSG